MQESIQRKLQGYINTNCPGMIDLLSEDLKNYLEEKTEGVKNELEELIAKGTPAYIIEEQVMNLLVNDLATEPIDYIKDILQEDFLSNYNQFLEDGILQYELRNILSLCQPLFEAFQDEENNTRRRE